MSRVLKKHVLTGFGTVLDQIQGVEIECRLRPLYKGQALLQEIYDLLDSHGLKLRKLSAQGDFDGELVELNAVFSRGGANALEEIWRLVNGIPLYRGPSSFYYGSTPPFRRHAGLTRQGG